MTALTYAVGDVHGRLDLLERAFNRIAVHAGARSHRVVMLGDYVDRGPDSSGVVAFLMRRQAEADVVCLKGNHEDMLLRTLAGEDGALRAWLANGGLETLRSYRARADSDLRGALPETHVDWLSRLPLTARDPHRIFVHAGLEPDLPLELQDEATLLWIRGPFLRAPAQAFEAHVVHGHTPLWEGKREASEPELLRNLMRCDSCAG